MNKNINSNQSKKNKWRFIALLAVLFILPIALTLYIQYSFKKIEQESYAPPELLLATPIPENLQIILSQKGNDRIYVRAIDRSTNTRLDIMSSTKPPKSIPIELLDALKRLKAFKEELGIASPISELFLALFNPLRAKLIDSQVINISQMDVTVSKVETKDDEVLYLGVFDSDEKQIGFAVLDLDKSLNRESLERSLKTIRACSYDCHEDNVKKIAG